MNPDTKLPLPVALHALGKTRHEAFAARVQKSGLPSALADPPVLPDNTQRIFALSDFIANTCIRNPEMLKDLLDSGDLLRPYPAGVYGRRARQQVIAVDNESALMKALRRLRNRELVRIAWRDLAGWSDLQATVCDASALAEALIDAALAPLHSWQSARFGTPKSAAGDPQSLVVLALGKLGAEELNFSSDVDLLFAYPEIGRTTGGPRSLSNDDYFVRLARRLVHVLNQPTEDGFVYRVDLRLRPFGTSGPLVMSFNALEHYYQTHGRGWERFAFTRARTVAGDIEQGQRLLERLRPFVYRRYLDYGVVEELRDMKNLLAEEVQRKGLQNNIKKGPGGIREIEFLCQTIQIIRGGHEPELRVRKVGDILTRLGERQYLPWQVADELALAYNFLRNTEHRLQEVNDRQIHVLPQDRLGRLRLGIGMGFNDWPSYLATLASHRKRVQELFDQVFAAPAGQTAVPSDPLQGLWSGSMAADQGIQALTNRGLVDASAAWQALEKFSRSSRVRLLSQRGRHRLEHLMPVLLGVIGKRGGALVTLQRVLQVIETIARRSVYLALLVENPVVLEQLVRLCEASPWITQQIAQHPLLLDELLDPRTLYAPPTRDQLQADMQARLARVPAADTEREMDALRQFKRANVLHIAAADVSKAMPLMVVSDHLTAIAEVALQAVLRLAWRDLSARYGEPGYRLDGKRRPAGFAIVGYGKLGGIELGYSSDLDLVFLHEVGDNDQHTDGKHPVDNAVFFSRLARRIIHYMSTHTSAGMLYDVDARLRPSGKSGLLVSSTRAFKDYQLRSAWTWEHQALVRARVVAGDAALAQWFADTRREVLCQPRDPGQLRQAVREMRDRMRAERAEQRAGWFDLKQGQGGIADIEFMVQYLTLRWASELGESLQFTDNIRLLDGFAKAGVLSLQDTELLANAYRGYRSWVHALALQEQQAIVDDSQFRKYRQGVIHIWQHLLGEV